MRQCYIILLVLVVYSCDYFNVKKTTPEAILKEDLKTFNWDEVDMYPSFSQCDTIIAKTNKKVCFESTLYAKMSTYLQQQNIVVTKDVNDTLMLKLRVSKKGIITLIGAEMDSLTKQEIPNLEKMLLKSLEQLPNITSAIKMSQPVRTEFELPLIIKVN
ncbi:hypothetical protein [Hyunsoonleella pacifica]|uniref:Uncharacterized protein n=1 Tax=Hyunsoonleella pacifica TaxID=1080224 RepID=A0A4Q9FNT8_9FLAO|nr:hypothetical protein [Hyunsoonleella pacifica]TBN15644.1 hypothetical protein EYD46_10985 [Hyunsoonleella pacifica]GGD21513.1 hypothetical protein GCM10011368_24350 [Hyunsoonleella pacifica]